MCLWKWSSKSSKSTWDGYASGIPRGCVVLTFSFCNSGDDSRWCHSRVQLWLSKCISYSEYILHSFKVTTLIRNLISLIRVFFCHPLNNSVLYQRDTLNFRYCVTQLPTTSQFPEHFRTTSVFLWVLPYPEWFMSLTQSVLLYWRLSTPMCVIFFFKRGLFHQNSFPF